MESKLKTLRCSRCHKDREHVYYNTLEYSRSIGVCFVCRNVPNKIWESIDEERVFVCFVCNKSLSSKSALKKHINVIHGSTPSVCSTTPHDCRAEVGSKGEMIIHEFLKSEGVPHLYDSHDGGLPINKKCLRFDFIVLTKSGEKKFIEYNGEHHTQPVRGDARLEGQKHHDTIKDNYCRANGYAILWLDIKVYSRAESIKKALREFMYLGTIPPECVLRVPTPLCVQQQTRYFTNDIIYMAALVSSVCLNAYLLTKNGGCFLVF
jgi:hypothetical protein